MKIRMTKLLAFLLLICITSASIPFSAFSSSSPEQSNYICVDYAAGREMDQNLVADEMREKAGQGIVEIESLREECSKHFQLEDGTYQAIAYGAAVHRLDADGKWRDIDNRLFADNAESGRYSTQDGRFSFAENVSADELYTIDDGRYRISFGAVFECSPRSTAVIENHANRKTAAEGLTGEEKLDALKAIDNTTKITYYTVNGGVDLEYIISGNDVKENIILSKPTDETVFTYRLKLSGLYAELSENNTVTLINSDGETVYCLTTPYMYDSAGAESAKITYTLAEDTEGYIITVAADSEWINDSERVFPITVDPTVTNTIQDDTYTYTNYPATNYGTSTSLYVDSNSITYMKRNMPSIPTYAKITSASLKIRYYFNGSSSGTTIGLYRCMRNWDANTLTYFYTHLWPNRGLSTIMTDSKTTTSGTIPASSPVTLSFNVLSLVRQWYAGGTNYGIGLKYESGTDKCVIIHSYESTSAYRPYFEITYSNNSSPIIQNGTYFIRNKSTQQYIDDYHDIAENESILQYEFTSDIEQRWIFRYAHWGDYYTIKTADSTSDYFIGVEGDSTSANADIVFRQGLDSNGTRTITDGMLWEISSTTSGAYKIQAITGQSGSNDLVMRAAPYTGSSIDIAIKQIAYTNNTNYKDEWLLIKPESTECSIFLSAKVETRTFSIQCIGSLATGTTWYPLIQASANSWNSSGAGTNITISTTSSPFTCNVDSYAATWYGQTVYSPSVGDVTSATIKINSRTCATGDNPRKSTITHEFGHLLGLADNPPISNDQSLMNHGRNRDTVYTPQAYDILNVIYIYSLS